MDTRIILDVLLSRLTSIRDCCFLLAAEIYELGIDPRNVNLRELKKYIANKGVVDVLINIADSARSMRDERDRHLHRGEERALSGESDQFFHVSLDQTAAMFLAQNSHFSIPTRVLSNWISTCPKCIRKLSLRSALNIIGRVIGSSR